MPTITTASHFVQSGGNSFKFDPIYSDSIHGTKPGQAVFVYIPVLGQFRMVIRGLHATERHFYQFAVEEVYMNTDGPASHGDGSDSERWKGRGDARESAIKKHNDKVRAISGLVIDLPRDYCSVNYKAARWMRPSSFKEPLNVTGNDGKTYRVVLGFDGDHDSEVRLIRCLKVVEEISTTSVPVSASSPPGLSSSDDDDDDDDGGGAGGAAVHQDGADGGGEDVAPPQGADGGGEDIAPPPDGADGGGAGGAAVHQDGADGGGEGDTTSAVPETAAPGGDDTSPDDATAPAVGGSGNESDEGSDNDGATSASLIGALIGKVFGPAK